MEADISCREIDRPQYLTCQPAIQPPSIRETQPSACGPCRELAQHFSARSACTMAAPSGRKVRWTRDNFSPLCSRSQRSWIGHRKFPAAVNNDDDVVHPAATREIAYEDDHIGFHRAFRSGRHRRFSFCTRCKDLLRAAGPRAKLSGRSRSRSKGPHQLQTLFVL